MNLLFYLVFNFIFYSFMGWIIEELYSFAITKAFKKEGFLIGPFKPMYGVAVSILVICKEVLDISGITIILLCFLVPTAVEYISGYMLKHVFNKVYWDYSQLKYNIQGFVTLKFSSYWMLLSYVGLYLLQPTVNNLYMQKQDFFYVLVIVGSSALIIDFYLTVNKFAH